jgi:hypothetical protein
MKLEACDRNTILHSAGYEAKRYAYWQNVAYFCTLAPKHHIVVSVLVVVVVVYYIHLFSDSLEPSSE